jgi:hypothetical protein
MLDVNEQARKMTHVLEASSEECRAALAESVAVAVHNDGWRVQSQRGLSATLIKDQRPKEHLLRLIISIAPCRNPQARNGQRFTWTVLRSRSC